jgi:hypothetical protein
MVVDVDGIRRKNLGTNDRRTVLSGAGVEWQGLEIEHYNCGKVARDLIDATR